MKFKMILLSIVKWVQEAIISWKTTALGGLLTYDKLIEAITNGDIIAIVKEALILFVFSCLKDK